MLLIQFKFFLVFAAVIAGGMAVMYLIRKIY
jgi:hypothetical protein